ncbi:hypothetical protein [Leptolyngbya sp. BL0902]|uniref:hypothetical protein n=1 Tax=Leptolyngbya sp. BL0902 TaxID=1115757 RepID=UPI0018E8F2FB|nr:hypothetical protein [Leptolyngbya sp. BL0902]
MTQINRLQAALRAHLPLSTGTKVEAPGRTRQIVGPDHSKYGGERHSRTGTTVQG